MSVLVVLGTRPEAIKLWPVIEELKAREVPFQVASTNQQKDLLEPFLKELGIEPDWQMEPQKPSAFQLVDFLAEATSWLARRAVDDLVIVQGDTTTALAGALAAFYNKVPVAHVEAGLRTYDLDCPFPEEGNRQMISRIATLHFAPTERACTMLGRDFVAGEVVLTGNTVVDALHRIKHRSFGQRVRSGAVFGARTHTDVLVTFHRRESWSEVGRVAEAIVTLAVEQKKRVRWVLHANPELRREIKLVVGDAVELLEPLSYTEFIYQLGNCDVVITDSGGVIEESTTLGVPLVVIRNETERSEALASARLCTLDRLSQLGSIVQDVLRTPRQPSNVFGDGQASKRIVDKIVEFLELG